MKPIKAFKAEDGTLFNTKQECVHYESMQSFKEIINSFVEKFNEGKDGEERVYFDDNSLEDLAKHLFENKMDVLKMISSYASLKKQGHPTKK